MSSIIRRYEKNPILTAKDIPYSCERCYNPAAVKFNGKYLLLVRVWGEGRKESLALATSDNGYDFEVKSEPVMVPEEIDQGRLNDPRITKIDDTYYICYCSDPESGIKLGIAKTKDFEHFEKFYFSEPDNRNAVLFPERINGLYARLDRPFARQYFLDKGYDIWISYSPDMEFWGKHSLLLSHKDVPWGSNKIGPGPQPIKTNKGWLVIYHGAEMIEEDENAELITRGPGWPKIYRAGVMLLDLENPAKVTALPKAPLISPETNYEKDIAYRPNVVFPSGAIVEDNGEVKIYYGASDTSVAVATTTIDELLDFCLNPVPYEHPYKPVARKMKLSKHA